MGTGINTCWEGIKTGLFVQEDKRTSQQQQQQKRGVYSNVKEIEMGTTADSL